MVKHKTGESYFQMDLYKVIFIIPSTGNRIIFDQVQAEVEIQEKNYEHKNAFGAIDAIIPLSHYLDIVLTIHHHDIAQLNEVKGQLYSEELYLHFKDAHPCLIRGTVRAMTFDNHNATVRFKGNTIDKTYDDYITEATTQLNEAFEYTLESENPIDDGKTDFDEWKEGTIVSKGINQADKEKKGKVIKRKLTF